MFGFWRFRELWIRLCIFVVLMNLLALVYHDYTVATIPSSGSIPLGIPLFSSFFNPRESLFATLIIFISSSTLISDYWITAFNTHFSELIITRRSRNWLIRRMLVTTFVFSFVIMLITQATALITIHFAVSPVSFQRSISSQYLIFANPIWAVIAGFLTHAIGYALLTDFVLMIGLWIKKPFVFRVSGLVISLMMYIGLAMLNTIPVIRNVLAYFFLPNLISPGQVAAFGSFALLQPPLFVFAITSCLYIALIVIGSWFWLKRTVLVMINAGPIFHKAYSKTALLILACALTLGPLLSWSPRLRYPMVVTLIINNSVSLTSNILFILLMNYHLGRLISIDTFLSVRMGRSNFRATVLMILLLDWAVYTVGLYSIESVAYGWAHIELRYVWLFFIVNALMYLLLVIIMSLSLTGVSHIITVASAILIEIAFHYVLIAPILPRFVQKFDVTK